MLYYGVIRMGTGWRRRKKDETRRPRGNWANLDTVRTALFITRKFLRLLVGISSTPRICSLLSSLFLYPSTSRRHIAELWYNIIFPVETLDQFAWHLTFKLLSLLQLWLSFHHGVIADSIITKERSCRTEIDIPARFYPLEIENWL